MARPRVQDGGFFIGADPASPAIGDLRIRFKAVRPGPVTIVARQVASSFEAYPTRAGDPILIVKEGTFSAEAVFKAEPLRRPGGRGVVVADRRRGLAVLSVALCHRTDC